MARGTDLHILDASGGIRKRLLASGSIWVHLEASGGIWRHLEASGRIHLTWGISDHLEAFGVAQVGFSSKTPKVSQTSPYGVYVHGVLGACQV